MPGQLQVSREGEWGMEGFGGDSSLPARLPEPEEEPCRSRNRSPLAGCSEAGPGDDSDPHEHPERIPWKMPAGLRGSGRVGAGATGEELPCSPKDVEL